MRSKKRVFSVFVAFAAILALVIPTSPLAAWHAPGGGGPTNSGVANLGSGAFSVPQTFLHPNGYVSCIIGNFEGIDPDSQGVPNQGHAREQHWKVLSRGPATESDGSHFIDVVIGATSVNIVEEAGIVVAVAIDEDGAKTNAVVHPLTFNGDTAFVTLNLRVKTDVAYDLVIENLDPPPSPIKRPAKHYKIGAVQGFVEVAYGDPTLEYREPGPNSDAFNIVADEPVLLVFSGDPGPFFGSGVTEPAVSITYQVFDPITQTVVVPLTTVDRSPGNLFTDPVSIAFTNDGTPRTLVLATDASLGHYKLVKHSGPDHGIYPLDCQQPPQPPPPGARTIGFWKNHEELIQQIQDGPKPIGNPALSVPTILNILSNSNAKDARDALRAQRMATILNLRNGAAPLDIGPVVNEARELLKSHLTPVDEPLTAKNKDGHRQRALELKTLLDEYNNGGEE